MSKVCNLSATSRIVDDLSPAAYLVVENNTLKYCYSSGYVCALDGL